MDKWWPSVMWLKLLCDAHTQPRLWQQCTIYSGYSFIPLVPFPQVQWFIAPLPCGSVVRKHTSFCIGGFGDGTFLFNYKRGIQQNIIDCKVSTVSLKAKGISCFHMPVKNMFNEKGAISSEKAETSSSCLRKTTGGHSLHMFSLNWPLWRIHSSHMCLS